MESPVGYLLQAFGVGLLLWGTVYGINRVYLTVKSFLY